LASRLHGNRPRAFWTLRLEITTVPEGSSTKMAFPEAFRRVLEKRRQFAAAPSSMQLGCSSALRVEADMDLVEGSGFILVI
jgi:hypothetical protein